MAELLVFYGARPHKRFGLIWAAVSRRGLWSASFGIDELEFQAHIQDRGRAHMVRDEAKVAPVLKQIAEFFAGKRKRFTLKVDWSGMTPFQVAVRKAVMAVPYGRTASYGEIAAAVGRPLAPRAVGGVQASNPIAIVIPCHRIIAADGGLGGYGGPEGLKLKAWLLEMEASNAKK
ncbi:MAG: methylated-DNA--[protein]-cysteine S-methyltransferase [Anaerolineales bacterium]